MFLSFKTIINKRPTGFPARILCLDITQVPGVIPGRDVAEFWPDAMKAQKKQVRPKVHTLREDETDRWHPGKTIHFATGVRTPKLRIFAVGTCISTQTVLLHYDGVRVRVWVDNRELEGAALVEFYQNDGFDSLEQFIDWSAPICLEAQQVLGLPYKTLKLIHWTAKRY